MTALALPFPRMTPELEAAAVAIDPYRALAERARDGESAAFTELYRRTQPLAWRVLYKVVGPSPDLEDLLQESYLQLMKALKTYRGEAKTTTFLHRVCVNVGLMHVRARRRRPEDATDEVPEHPTGEAHDPERAVKVAQAQRLLRQALATLSEEKATVFTYHDLLGLKPEEISELTGAPPNTVRSRLNRAREDFTRAVTALRKGEALA